LVSTVKNINNHFEEGFTLNNIIVTSGKTLNQKSKSIKKPIFVPLGNILLKDK